MRIPERKKKPSEWADWLAQKIYTEVEGATRKELFERGRKWRIQFKEGDYVDVHRYEAPDKYAVHYRHPAGTFVRWNNALDRDYPKIPHLHAGVEGVREERSEDLSKGDPKEIVGKLKAVRKKLAEAGRGD